MSIKPILFNTDMVRAILDGRKTVTRRVVKGYALEHLELDTDGSIIGVYDQFEGRVFPVVGYAPYRSGDILYVRETWMDMADAGYMHCFKYKADQTSTGMVVADELGLKWRPSTNMPREAARIFLRVTDVRVERLQEICGGDLLKEGIDLYQSNFVRVAFDEFASLWDSTVKPADRALHGWDANPWVWVIEFERCEKPGKEG